jgi:hypothetical protein
MIVTTVFVSTKPLLQRCEITEIHIKVCDRDNDDYKYARENFVAVYTYIFVADFVAR